MDYVILQILKLETHEMCLLVLGLVILSAYLMVISRSENTLLQVLAMVPLLCVGVVAAGDMQGDKLISPISHLKVLNRDAVESEFFLFAVKNNDFTKAKEISDKWVNPVVGDELVALGLLRAKIQQKEDDYLVQDALAKGYLDRSNYTRIVRSIKERERGVFSLAGGDIK